MSYSVVFWYDGLKGLGYRSIIEVFGGTMFSRKIFHATSYVTLTQSLIALAATFALAGEVDPFWGTMGVVGVWFIYVTILDFLTFALMANMTKEMLSKVSYQNDAQETKLVQASFWMFQHLINQSRGNWLYTSYLAYHHFLDVLAQRKMTTDEAIAVMQSIGKKP